MDMIKVVDDFAEEYTTAIRSYIRTEEEIALQRAYEIGRKALDSGRLILDVAQVHSQAITHELVGLNDEDRTRVISTGAAFLSEFLSPFEMTLRGFMDLTNSLRFEIEERKKAEQALQKSERYYKSLIENTLDIVSIIDENGFQKYASPSITRILGYSQAELIGKNVFEFVHPEDVDSVLELFHRGKEVQYATAYAEFRFRHKNGDWLILESIGKNLLDDPSVEGIIINSRDITERRNLEEIRRKYEFIANASIELMSLINSDYCFEAVNDAYCTSLSKNRADIIGAQITDVLGKEIFESAFKSNIDRAFSGVEMRYEGWLKLPNLGKRFLEIDYYPYRNIHSRVTHAVTVIRDATKRKKTEDEIHKSQARLAEAQRIAHIGSWELEIATDRVICSRELSNMLGIDYRTSEITFGQFLSHTHEDDRGALEEVVSGALRQGIPFTIQHRLVRTDGAIRIVQTRGEPLRNEADTPSIIIGTSQDVTERELAQEAMRESEEKYRRLFETSKEGILLLQSPGGTIMDVNPFTLEFLGFTKKKFVGKRIWKIEAVDGIPETERAFREVTAMESVHYDELELNAADGTRRKIELVSIAYPSGNSRIIQCHLWDITERRRLQEELDRNERQRAEDLRRFAMSTQKVQEDERRRISRELHDDICQQLTAINLHLNVLENSVVTKKRISLKRLRSIEKDTVNLIAEVRRISYNLRPSALDHFGLVTALKLLCSEFRKLQGIRIDFDSDVPTRRRFDPDAEIALYRIAQEAFANSVRHGKAKQANLTIAETDGKLTLSVTDDGTGFDATDYFSRTDITKHFGLMNMRERAQLLGGIFQLRSAINEGTEIAVTVPIISKGNGDQDDEHHGTSEGYPAH